MSDTRHNQQQLSGSEDRAWNPVWWWCWWGLIFVALVTIAIAYKLADWQKYGDKTRIEVAQIRFTNGYRRVRELFEQKHPELKLVFSPGNTMNEQKLMCSIAGGAPPDVVWVDRFTMGGWAARGAFMPLDEFIERDGIDPDDFYDACWQEACYGDQVYGIPDLTDVRVLFYNETLLRREGFVDPETGKVSSPKDWDELEEYAQKLTKYNEHGDIIQLGYVPIFMPVPGLRFSMIGNSWLYLYGWQAGGAFMSPDGTTCTLNHPEIEYALTWVLDFFDNLGGLDKVQAFQTGFQTGALHPFLTGEVAMITDSAPFMRFIAMLAPDLPFGVSLPPGRTPELSCTWSGGFAWAIPAGARNPEAAWEFIKFVTSREGVMAYEEAEYKDRLVRGQLHLPDMYANASLNTEVQERFVPDEGNLRSNTMKALDMFPKSRFRPVSPVGKQLWDEHVRATELAVRGTLSPAEALRQGTIAVQQQLEQMTDRSTLTPINWRVVSGGIVVVIAVLLVVVSLQARSARKYYQSRMVWQETRAAYLFIMPWLIGLLVFSLGPILASLFLSFCEYDVLHPPQWIGGANYAQMLGLSLERHESWWPGNWTITPTDRIFWKSLHNTLFMMLGIPLSITVGLLLAMLLLQERRGIGFFRTMYFLPSIVPIVASSVLWIWILEPERGLINSLVQTLTGWRGPGWLMSPVWAKPALILMGLWGAGGGLIIWLAGLKGIPDHLYEAARIDGANAWGRFRHVTLPMLTPYIFFNLVMGIIATLQIFAQAYIMTEGGPADSTLFYVYYLFNHAFQYFRMGYASALAWILFLIVASLTLIQLKLAPRWVYYEKEDTN